MKEIKDNSIDLVITDPPYGMSFQSWYRKVKHKKIIWDSNLDRLDDFLSHIKRVSKPEAHLYIFCSLHFVDVFVSNAKIHLPYKNIIIREKNNTGMGDLYWDYAPKYEFIIYCSNWKKKLNWSRDPNIYKSDRRNNELHPTQKPTRLIKYLISKSSKGWDSVLDCFALSWTTWVACKELWRDCILIEKEPKYIETIKKRLATTTISLFH